MKNTKIVAASAAALLSLGWSQLPWRVPMRSRRVPATRDMACRSIAPHGEKPAKH